MKKKKVSLRQKRGGDRQLVLLGLTHLTIATAATSEGGGNRKVFDMTTQKYVDPDLLLSPYQKAMRQFNKHQAASNLAPQWKQLASKMNQQYHPIFCDRSIHSLRYSYYHEFSSDYATIYNSVSRDNEPYMGRIRSQRQTSTVVGLPLLLATMDDELDALAVVNANAANVYNTLASPSFWTNVYHDIRLEPSFGDHFEHLPPMAQTMNFFNMVIDYVLVNLVCLRGDCLKLTKVDDVQVILGLRWWHLRDHHYQYLAKATEHYYYLFNLSPNSVDRADVLRVVVSTIIDNMTLNLLTDLNVDGCQKVMATWKHFLQFIAIDMFANREYIAVGGTSRNNLVIQDGVSTFSALSQQLTQLSLRSLPLEHNLDEASAPSPTQKKKSRLFKFLR